MRLNRPTSPGKSGRLPILVIILLLAYALRLIGLEAESLWIDEGYSLALAGHTLSDIIRGTAADQHPPLYYFLLHYWLSAGQSVFYSRYLSVLLGVLGIAAAILVGKALLGWKASLVSGVLLACSPMHIWYSQEVRMYILLALFTTLSCYLTWRIIQEQRGWIPYVLISSLALYTHYFASFVLLAENVFILGWWLMRRKNHWLARWAGTQGTVAALFAPWLPTAIYQARAHKMTWIQPPTARDVQSTLSWVVLGDSGSHWSSSVLIGGLMLIALAMILTSFRTDRKAAYSFLALWFGLPLGAIVGISQLYPIFQSKQFLFLVIPVLVLLSGSLIELERAPRLILTGVVLVIVAGSTGNMYASATKHGWREAATYIEKHWEKGDVLYLNPAAGKMTLEAYLSPMPPHAGYPTDYDVVEGGWDGERVTRTIAGQVLSDLALNYQRIWLIEFGPGFWDPEGNLATWLAEHSQLRLDETFRGIRVRLYDLDKRD
jgi:mannosyltransferase